MTARLCATCRRAPEHQTDPHRCAFCRGRADRPDWEPYPEDKEETDGIRSPEDR